MYKVTKDEIEVKRSPSQIYEWVFSTLNNFSTKDEKTSLRTLSYPEIKVFIEESYPLAYFCNHFFGEDGSVKINQMVGSQSYDAKVEGCEKFTYIEITNAINGYNEKLRNCELDKTGSVPAVGGITIVGTKASGRQMVEFENIAVRHDDIKDEQKELILQIVNKKSKIKYPSKTMLIIGFSDNISFKTKEDILELELFMKDKISSEIGDFVGLCLVGFSGNVFISI